MIVYILKSNKDGSFYVGSTKDIEKRIMQHNKGQNMSTKLRRPWVLIKTEEYSNNLLAIKREKFLKTGDGRRVLKSLCLVGVSATKSSADGRQCFSSVRH